MLKPFVCLVFLFLSDVVLGTPDYKYNRNVNGWLKLYKVPATFEEAFLTCHYDGAVLASPLTVDLADALSLIMRQSEMNRPIFLGVNSMTSTRTFLSIEGVPLDDMPVTWGSYGDGKRPEQCLTLSHDNKVHIVTCQQYLPYICYKKYDKHLRMNECGTFDNNYKYKDTTGSCYKVHRGARSTWMEAHKTCVAEGGHLVVLNDVKEKDMVLALVLEATANNMTQTDTPEVHIGLKRWFYTLWLTVTDVVLGTPDYKYNRNVNGWLKLYKVPATFEEAFLTCHDDGAVLASPLTVDLADALSLIMRQSEMNRPIFLGVNSMTSTRTFLSIEGVPLDDMPVTWGSYGDGKRPEQCLTLSHDNKVHIVTCQQYLPYICYKKYDKHLRMNECGTFDNNYKYKDTTGSCYKVHRGARSTWMGAHKTCVAEGGHLVVLNDAKEKDMVLALVLEATANNMTQTDTPEVHIGLKRWFYTLWLTVTGDDIGDVYNKWVHGKPDLKGVCVGMLRDGTLEDYSCGIHSDFVCEKNPKTSRFERVSDPEEYTREAVSIMYTTTEGFTRDPYYVTQLMQETAK